MKTSLWGSSAWKFLHAVTFAYPESPTTHHRTAAVQLFKSLLHMLPCGECCTNYQNEFSEENITPHLKSRDSLSRWLVILHNNVNRRLGKPEMTYEQVEAVYPDDNTCDLTCHDDHPHRHRAPLWMFFPLFLLGLLVVYLYMPVHKLKFLYSK